jgi:cytochrome-b5 reductase|tara:strand:- start:113 stop:1039 length:927 start_codon:yes stop_codon:yes gene_type:complete
MITAEMLGLPPGKDVEALVATIALVVVALVFLLDRLRPAAPKTLDGSKVALPLVERVKLSHDTHLFRFGLPTPEHVLGLPIGQHVMLSYVDEDGKEVGRPYTPTSSDVDVGRVDFVVKVYFPCEKFPAGGKVSQHMHSLKVGDTMDFTGPKGMIEYRGRGRFAIRRLRSQGGGFEIRDAKRVGMIAGGTGITPMLQIMRAAFRDRGDTTDLSLLFANQTEGDILLRDEIDAAAKDHANFKAHYTVDRAPAKGWAYDEGFITAEMIEKHMPPPGPKTQILFCGPPAMFKFAVEPAFEKLGYTKDMFLQW